MTPVQYSFPYFFNLTQFNTSIHPFGLLASVVKDNATQLPEQLVLTNTSNDVFFSIAFGCCFMIDGHQLLVWETDTDSIQLQEISLSNTKEQPWILETKLGLGAFSIGKNKYISPLSIENFVSFARKSSLVYNQEAYEQFVLVLVKPGSVNIVPLHAFNQTTSAYDYAWPVVARVDFATQTLYGQGMRMKDFSIDMAWAEL